MLRSLKKLFSRAFLGAKSRGDSLSRKIVEHENGQDKGVPKIGTLSYEDLPKTSWFPSAEHWKQFHQSILHLFPDGLCFFDLETTGLSPLGDQVVEIGALILTSHQSKNESAIETFWSLANPMRTMPAVSLSIHHITDAMVSSWPPHDQVVDSFIDYLKKSQQRISLVAHHAKFDIGFLLANYLTKKDDESPFTEIFSSDVYCSLELARNSLKKDAPYFKKLRLSPLSKKKNSIFFEQNIIPKQFKLSELAKRFEFPLQSHHRATDDAIAAFGIFAHLYVGTLLGTDFIAAPEKIVSTTKNLSTFDKKTYLQSFFQFSTGEFLHQIDLKKFPAYELLVEPLCNHTPCMMKYLGGSYKGIYRPVKPLSLLPMPYGPVLYAYCYVSQMHKTFVLQKMKDLYPINEEHIVKLKEYELWPWKQFPLKNLEQDLEKIKVKFDDNNNDNTHTTSNQLNPKTE